MMLKLQLSVVLNTPLCLSYQEYNGIRSFVLFLTASSTSEGQCRLGVVSYRFCAGDSVEGDVI